MELKAIKIINEYSSLIKKELMLLNVEYSSQPLEEEDNKDWVQIEAVGETFYIPADDYDQIEIVLNNIDEKFKIEEDPIDEIG